jgi:hypothetical protein
MINLIQRVSYKTKNNTWFEGWWFKPHKLNFLSHRETRLSHNGFYHTDFFRRIEIFFYHTKFFLYFLSEKIFLYESNYTEMRKKSFQIHFLTFYPKKR